jgi:hypothetical protein
MSRWSLTHYPNDKRPGRYSQQAGSRYCRQRGCPAEVLDPASLRPCCRTVRESGVLACSSVTAVLAAGTSMINGSSSAAGRFGR